MYSKKKYEGEELSKEDMEFVNELKKENMLLQQQLKAGNLPKPQVLISLSCQQLN